jgi:hypothetical protein
MAITCGEANREVSTKLGVTDLSDQVTNFESTLPLPRNLFKKRLTIRLPP